MSNGNKNKYIRALQILKKYLSHHDSNHLNYDKREQLIKIWLNKYSKWTSDYFNQQFDQKNMSLVNIFEKLNQMNETNKEFMNESDSIIYFELTIKAMMNSWEKYLNNLFLLDQKIDEYVISTFNNINLTQTKYNEITLNFCKKWLSKMQSQINLSNYDNIELFNNLKKISPFITHFSTGHNKSTDILKIISQIYIIDNNLIGYVTTGIISQIKKIYSTYSKSKSSDDLNLKQIIN